jgi:hypothetical protein
MRGAVKGLALLLTLFIYVSACKNSDKQKPGTITSDIVNNTATASGRKVSPGSQPQFSFADETHDFGRITQGEKVSYGFKFKNTGGSDLLITEAHGSCGCTVPRYPRDPIPPNGEGVIDVTFDSDGKSGRVDKTVTVMGNTSPNTKILKISIIVEVPDEK